MSSQDQEREELEAKLQEYVGVVQGPAEIGPDPVNEAMIRHWCEVLGDRNPIYTIAEAAASRGTGHRRTPHHDAGLDPARLRDGGRRRRCPTTSRTTCTSS